ncbi:adenylyl-sulfate kinase [Bacillus canaveralius]|uniref:Adenylyl-sulfate kinase n=1 Tax=Bacillus canaveralius TaxID=1403243 RepID=A0A2N5GLE4_9BACI|nr:MULTISPECIES: adenylyl-sulfate kinase [Bacillus]PLR82409.1 adenylyl-sulfate kinase [Bacillus canaveralius]PLR85660.1 adenylyl-sulfate kinase [Bacillus sp. V33-4]PLR95580.1 adenylyl-sulfate kinase [Bacillus canaveralius]RSK52804.1 adenylyl-sulfate kinase [Bacillus canaveralius]
MASNIVWHPLTVTKAHRQKRNGHRSFVLWFTGLSGSGKSTLANEVDRKLFTLGAKSYVLDGDNVRHGLNKGLGFSKEDRVENIRRVGEVAKLFVDSGQIVLTTFISPFREDRRAVRNLFEQSEFIEIYVKCPLEVCEKRDPKGLYKKARKGEIRDFTGIDSPYEIPETPELVIDTSLYSLDDAVATVIRYLIKQQLI